MRIDQDVRIDGNHASEPPGIGGFQHVGESHIREFDAANDGMGEAKRFRLR